MNWFSIPFHFILHKLHTSNTGNKQLISSSCQASLFPLLCLQNCQQFSSASFVPSQLSIYASQIHVTGSSVDNLEHGKLSSCPALASEGCHFIWKICTGNIIIHFLCQIHYSRILIYDLVTLKVLIDLLTNWYKVVGQVST